MLRLHKSFEFVVAWTVCEQNQLITLYSGLSQVING